MPKNAKSECSTSIVIPSKNESENLDKLLPLVKKEAPTAEILVVDDGSTDNTQEICKKYGVQIARHPYSMGNGAAIKTGARTASGRIFVFMDADGQHDPKDIPRLLKKIDQGFEMAVGARHPSTQASTFRRVGNFLFNKLASLMTGYKVPDLTSGFRAVRSRHFRRFLYLLPNGFSYPTTITMAFFRSGLPVGYIPIKAGVRGGKSHVGMMRDGARFFVIILKIGALFSPMRLFIPISGALFFTGLVYYGYTFFSSHRFTNMSAVLLLSSLLTFLIGLVSEQISSLHYRGIDEEIRRRRP